MKNSIRNDLIFVAVIVICLAIFLPLKCRHPVVYRESKRDSIYVRGVEITIRDTVRDTVFIERPVPVATFAIAGDSMDSIRVYVNEYDGVIIRDSVIGTLISQRAMINHVTNTVLRTDTIRITETIKESRMFSVTPCIGIAFTGGAYLPVGGATITRKRISYGLVIGDGLMMGTVGVRF